MQKIKYIVTDTSEKMQSRIDEFINKNDFKKIISVNGAVTGTNLVFRYVTYILYEI